MEFWKEVGQKILAAFCDLDEVGDTKGRPTLSCE
jgi:hypothetical protein